MKKMINRVNIYGYVYQVDPKRGISVKSVSNPNSPNFGKQYISGILDIATDEDGVNVIPVHFSYVPDDGKRKQTFDFLKSIIDNPEKTWIVGGKENALRVRVSGNIELNEFINRNNELVSSMQVAGGMIFAVNGAFPEMKARNEFEVDMVLNGVTHVEANEESGQAELVRIKGAIFDFRGSLLPVMFTVEDEPGMNYYDGLDASISNPLVIHLFGNIENSTVTRSYTIESAYGEPEVRTSEYTRRSWRVRTTSPGEADLSEETITPEELKKAMQDREVKLAEIRRQADVRNNQSSQIKPQSSMDYVF